MIQLADLRCYECGSPDIVLIEPGSEPTIDPVTDIMVDRGQAARATCVHCWLPLAGHQQSLWTEYAP